VEPFLFLKSVKNFLCYLRFLYAGLFWCRVSFYFRSHALTLLFRIIFKYPRLLFSKYKIKKVFVCLTGLDEIFASFDCVAFTHLRYSVRQTLLRSNSLFAKSSYRTRQIFCLLMFTWCDIKFWVTRHFWLRVYNILQLFPDFESLTAAHLLVNLKGSDILLWTF
jgi:hypothetical protein